MIQVLIFLAVENTALATVAVMSGPPTALGVFFVTTAFVATGIAILWGSVK